MTSFIRENINWIKDIGTLVFTATGTAIAILTYLRARATILQPIRSEVIKKQSELLSSLLSEINEIGGSFEKGFDYINLVQVNVMLSLNDLGFIFSDHKDTESKLNETINGWIPCGDCKILFDVEVVGTFKEEKLDNAQAPMDYGRVKYENAKDGIITIDKIYITKQHQAFINKLHAFASNPFMPQAIQKIFNDIFMQLSSNLKTILKKELEIFTKEFCAHYFKEGKAPKFDAIGVYNKFNHSRIHHQKSLFSLKEEIRKYLLVDEPW